MLINISVIISIIASLFVIKYFVNRKVIILIENRISNIDGLRGYLALGVFFHHFIITYYWQKTGIWKRSPENFYNNLAELSVALFFMITGYLFFKVILKNDLDIKKFFKKRFFRLVPIYYFVVMILILFVMIQTEFQLKVSIQEFLLRLTAWFFFLQTNINDYIYTNNITASVTWTLKYEWLFYIFVPILYYLNKIKYLLNLLFILVLYISIFPIKIFLFNSSFFILFFLGMLFIKIENNFDIKKFNFNNVFMSFINLTLILFLLFYFESGYGFYQFLILGVIFFSILSGNTFFGILNLTLSRALGEITYSFYLIHGLILFLIFSMLFPNLIKTYNELYFFLMPLTTIIITIISIYTYKLIELPMIEKGKK
jgi:peptidoglycan/LPS O-acetylase OafA/YrhL